MDIFHDVKWKKDMIVMFLLGLSTLLFLHIPRFPARCREYVGEIYELEYYYHPPILLLSSFSFTFSLFFTLLYTNYHWWGLFVILSKYIHMRSCFGGFLLKGIQWCNQNLICFFIFWAQTMGPTTRCHGLSGLLRWHGCMLGELPNGELLYRSYRLSLVAR
jgi:hypothetical protein